MFAFVVRRLYFLKHIPFAPQVFDSFMKVSASIFNPALNSALDTIEREVTSWNGVNSKLHKYGGIEFSFHGKELGHIHSNGLLDILFSLEIKKKLLHKGLADHHHKFPDSGWISFYIRKEGDENRAVQLLKYSYQVRSGLAPYSP